MNLGLDLSEKAIEICQKLQQQRQIPDTQLEFQVADYFTYQPVTTFNFIFDYLFFAALAPELRGVVVYVYLRISLVVEIAFGRGEE